MGAPFILIAVALFRRKECVPFLAFQQNSMPGCFFCMMGKEIILPSLFLRFYLCQRKLYTEFVLWRRKSKKRLFFAGEMV